MKIQIVSADKILIDSLLQGQQNVSLPVIAYSGVNNPLDIVDFVFSGNPKLLILDDDFASPESVKIIKSIRSMKESLIIIFLTSDNSLSLGKAISGLAVQYYGIKPLTDNELQLAMQALLKNRISKTTN